MRPYWQHNQVICKFSCLIKEHVCLQFNFPRSFNLYFALKRSNYNICFCSSQNINDNNSFHFLSAISNWYKNLTRLCKYNSQSKSFQGKNDFCCYKAKKLKLKQSFFSSKINISPQLISIVDTKMMMMMIPWGDYHMSIGLGLAQ